jgi:hypothetical protein
MGKVVETTEQKSRYTKDNNKSAVQGKSVDSNSNERERTKEKRGKTKEKERK